MPWNTSHAIFPAVPLALLLALGCATPENKLAGKVVCPNCRDIPIEYHDANRYNYSDVAVGAFRTDRVAHACPNCHGPFSTFLKEGKFKHKCSVCEAKGYVCPINHPVKGAAVEIRR